MDGFLSGVHDDVEMEIHCPQAFPWIKRAKGVDEFRHAVLHNFSSLDLQSPTIVSVVAQGDVVDVMIAETGTIKASNQRYDVVGFQQFVFKGDKISRFREVLTERTP